MELDQFRDVDLVIDRANDSFVQKQFVSQGDYKGRTLTVQVTNNGNVGEVPGLTLNLNWHNEASGITDLTAFSVISKTTSVFSIEYPQHMMTPGKVYASIQVIQNGKVTNLKEFELTVQKLAGQSVGIVDKAEFSALISVLADSNKFRSDIDTLGDKKADKEFVQETVERVQSGFIGEYSSVAALNTAYPNGRNGYAVIFETVNSESVGYMYTWRGSAWIKGNVFGGNVVPDKSITTPKLASSSVTESKTVFFETGRNLFNKDDQTIQIGKGFYLNTSEVIDSENHNISANIAGDEFSTIYVSASGNEVSSGYKVASFKGNTWLSTKNYEVGGIKLSSGADNFVVQYRNSDVNVQVELNVLTAYEPFKTALKDTYTKHIRVDGDMLNDKVVSPQKTSFFDVGTGKNLFDIDDPEIQIGKGYSGETSTIVETSTYNLSGKMRGNPNDVIYVTVNNALPSSSNDLKFIEYDENDQWIKTKLIGSTGTETLSSNTGYFILQFRPTHINIMVSVGKKELYEPYKKQVKNQYVKIEEESQIKNGLITKDMLAFDIDDESTRTKEIDLIIFAGQSNMGGRGTASQAPVVKEGIAYEFRAVSDPTKLYPVTEPFGVNENKEGGISETSKTGSLVSAMVNNYYAKTSRKIVGVSASQGGTRISQWQLNGTLLPDAIERLSTAVSWLESNDYTIGNKWLVWCQGEGDGTIATTVADYKAGLSTMIAAFENAGINHTFIIRTGNNRDDPTKYDAVIQAQTEFCQEQDNATLIATTFDRFASDGLMKDEFHYVQEAYNRCGQQAGKNLAYYANTGKEPTMFDWENQNLYFSHKAD